MEKTVLDSCGIHSEKLIEISNTLVEQKIKKGEIPTKEDIWEIDSKIFEAYQTILATAKDSNTINRAIHHFKNAVENGGITSNLNNLATSATLKSIEEIQNNLGQEGNNYEVIQKVAGFQITKEGLENFQKCMQEKYEHNYFQTKDFDKVKQTNEEITNIVGKENIESIIEKSNNGDIDSARKLMIIQNAQIILGYNSNVEKIPEDRMQDYLKDMILLSEYTDISEIKTIYEKMAEKLPEDAFEKSNDGIKRVSDEKLKQMYKLANNGNDIDIEFFKNIYTDMAEQYVQNKEYQFINGAEDFTVENTIEGQKRMLQKNYSVCIEEAKKSPENYKYAMYELRENSKKYLDASLRLAEDMSLTGVDSSELEIFENLVESVLDGLSESKNGTEFVDDEYTKASKKNLFKSIVDNKNLSNQDLLEKIVKADSDISKDILKDMLEEYNNSPNQIMSDNIQILGNLIRKVGEKEKVLPVDIKAVETVEDDAR